MTSPRKVFALGILCNRSISFGASADSREDSRKESDDVGGCNHVKNRIEVQRSMRRVEDMVCRICDGTVAIAAESIQVQNFKRRTTASRSRLEEWTSCLAAK